MRSRFLFVLVSGLALLTSNILVRPTLAQNSTTNQAINSESKTYKDWLKEASSDLKGGKMSDALAAAQAAGKLNPKGYEAPAMAALILAQAHRPAEAKSALATATALVPDEKRATLEAIAKQVEASQPAAVESAPPSIPSTPALDGQSQIEFDALMLVVQEAERAAALADRQNLLKEFLEKSGAFLKQHPEQGKLWLSRAVAAMELNDSKTGWEAGQKLLALGYANSADPKVHQTLVLLERKGWLNKTQPSSSVQSQDQSAKEIVNWMKDHLADLSCTIKASADYDISDEPTQDGAITQTSRYWGTRTATFAFIPLDISFDETNAALRLKLFELHENRYSGTSEVKTGSAYVHNDQKDPDIQRDSRGAVYNFSFFLKSISVADDVVPKQDFYFGSLYLNNANAPSPPEESGNNNNPYVKILSTSIGTYQNPPAVYELVIRQKRYGGILGSWFLGEANSGSAGRTTTIYISEVGKDSRSYNSTDLPQNLSSWTNPRQDANDPAAIKDWLIENGHLGNLIDWDTPGVGICTSNPHELEKWRQALSQLVRIYATQEPAESRADDSPHSYEDLIIEAGKLINRGDFDAARQKVWQALQMDNAQWRGNALMAAVLERQDKYDEADPYLSKAMAAAPRPVPFSVVAWTNGTVLVRDIPGIMESTIGK